MRTKPKTGTARAKKRIPKKAKIVLFFSVPIMLLIIGYLIYPTNDCLQRTGDKKKDSTSATRGRQDTEKGRNLSLKITKAKLQLESVDNIDRLRVVVEENRDDRSNINHKYEWFEDGVSVGDNNDSLTGFKKGDKVDVRITPFNGKESGQPVFLSMAIAHVPPKVVENKTVNFDGNTLSHQVKAVDPDDGTLSYSLVDAPKEMAIDSKTGMINWDVNKNEHGKHNINVMIKSSNGAQTLYPLSIDLGKANQ
jgi:hypothetical protein